MMSAPCLAAAFGLNDVLVYIARRDYYVKIGTCFVSIFFKKFFAFSYVAVDFSDGFYDMGRKRDARFFRVEQGDFGQVDCPRRNFLGDFLRSFSRIVNRAADGDCRAVREQPSVCHVLHNHVGHRHVVCVHTVYAEQPQNGALNGDGGVKVDIALRVRGILRAKCRALAITSLSSPSLLLIQPSFTCLSFLKSPVGSRERA